MQSLDVHIDGDKCWPDLGDYIIGKWEGIARLENATAKGKSTVTVRVRLPDGQVVLAQTTLALLVNAVKAFEVAERM